MAFRGGGGIRYDSENVGNFLDVVAKKISGFSNAGISLLANGAAGAGDVAVNVFQNSADPSTLAFENASSGTTTLQGNGGGPVSVQANGVGAASDLKVEQNQTAGTLHITNNGTGDLTIASNNSQIHLAAVSPGMLLEQFGGAAKIQFTPSTPSIDIVASVELLLSGNSDVTIEGNGGANGKIVLGTGGGGNGGVLITTPPNGASPTYEVDVNAGTTKIQAGDGFLKLVSGDMQMLGLNGGVTSNPGVDVSSNPAGHPIVLLCKDAAGFLGFFGHAGQAQIPGSSITTLAQLVTALQNYGLLG